MGTITLDLLLSEDVHVKHTFYVVKNQHTPALLGIDFLTKARVMFDPEEQALFFRVRDDGEGQEDQIYMIPTHPGSGRGGVQAPISDDNEIVAINVTDIRDSGGQCVSLAEPIVLSSGEVHFARLDLASRTKEWKQDQILTTCTQVIGKGVIMLPTVLTRGGPFYVVLLNAGENQVNLPDGHMLGYLSPRDMNHINQDNVLTDINEIASYLDQLYRNTGYHTLPSDVNGPWFKPTVESVQALQRKEVNIIDINSCEVVIESPNHELGEKGQDTDSRLDGFDINPELNPEQIKEIQKLILKYRNVFATSLRDVQAVKAPPYKIQLKPNAVPRRVTPRMVPHDANHWFKGFIDELLDMKLIEPCSGPWAAAVVLIPSDRCNKRR